MLLPNNFKILKIQSSINTEHGISNLDARVFLNPGDITELILYLEMKISKCYLLVEICVTFLYLKS